MPFSTELEKLMVNYWSALLLDASQLVSVALAQRLSFNLSLWFSITVREWVCYSHFYANLLGRDEVSRYFFKELDYDCHLQVHIQSSSEQNNLSLRKKKYFGLQLDFGTLECNFQHWFYKRNAEGKIYYRKLTHNCAMQFFIRTVLTMKFQPKKLGLIKVENYLLK